jgi:hypothetical protein
LLKRRGKIKGFFGTSRSALCDKNVVYSITLRKVLKPYLVRMNWIPGMEHMRQGVLHTERMFRGANSWLEKGFESKLWRLN